MNYLRCLYREGETWNLRGTSTLSGGLGFTALNYSHSIAPVEKIEWWTGIYPPILSRGTYGELVLKEIFGTSEDVQNILIKNTQ